MKISHINAKCRFLLGAFFSLNCVVLSYVTFFLLKRGFSEKVIGVLIAAACLLGGVLQPIAGRIADRSKKWYWKNQLTLYAAIELGLMLLLVFVKNKVLTGLLFGLAILFVLLMMPMVIAASFYYTARDAKVNFGVARGIGSLTFAVVSALIGKITAKLGFVTVPILGGVFCAVLLAAVFIMPKIEGEVTQKKADKDPSSINRGAFFRKYPVFITIAVGMGLVLVLHNIVNTYFVNIVKNAGGGVDDLGTALAISAAAEIPVMMLYSRFCRKTQLSSKTLIAAACCFFVARGVLYCFASSVTMVYMVSLLQSVTFGLLTAANANFAYETMEPEDATLGQSVMTMTNVFGSVMGSFLGGILIGAGGVSFMLWCGTGVALAGTLTILGALLYKRKG